jgi:hypothetical protein
VIALFCANVLSAQIAAGTRLYLEPTSQWREANARLVAAFVNGDNAGVTTWVQMRQVSNSNLFEVIVPAGNHRDVVLTRMAPGTNFGWSNPPLWNQTNDISLEGESVRNGTHNLIRITGTNNNRPPTEWDRINTIGGTWYLLPNEQWLSAVHPETQRFAAYFQNGSYYNDDYEGVWENMYATGGDGGFYYVNAPAGNWIGVTFVRMNGNTTENNWNNSWSNPPPFHHIGNQVLERNLCIITGWSSARYAQYGINLGSFTASTWSGHFENLIPTTFFLNGVDETQEINVLVVDVTEDETSFNIFQSDVALLASQSLYSQVIIPSGSIIRAAAHWHPIEEAKDNTHTVVLPYGIVSINGEEINEHENFEFNVVVPRTGTVTISGEPVTHNTQSFGDALPAPESLQLNIENIPVPENITTPTMKVTFNLATNKVIFEPVSTGPGTNVNTPNESGNVIFTVGRTIRIEMEQENNRVMLFNSLGQMIHSADAGSTFEFTTASAGVYFVRVNESNYKVIVR